MNKDIKSYDVIIIGGGINGAGVARELALRNISVALYEKNDFASGTSSISSKLVHGGLRYLEHGHFNLVKESLTEQFRLIQNAPHLVKPLPFIFPFYQNQKRPKWLVNLGLKIYDHLSRHQKIQPSQNLSINETIKKEPWLNQNGLKGSSLFYDAQTNDARLCLETLLQAQQFGAKIHNYHEVIKLNFQDNEYKNIIVKDELNNKTFTAQGKIIINATGPWGEQTLKLAHPNNKLIKLCRGSHIVTKRLSNHHAIIFTAQSDHRVMFIIPWGQYSLIGTTETDYTGSLDNIKASDEELEYLINEANLIVPKAKLTRNCIISQFSGVRPLISSPKSKLSSVSRKHQLIENSNLITLIGGKYTTYRAISEQVAQRVHQKLKIKSPFESITHSLPLFGGDIKHIEDYAKTHYELDQQLCPISQEQYYQLISYYGSAYANVLHIIAETKQNQQPLPHHDHLEGEVRYAIRFEMARKISDFCRRRTNIALSEDKGEHALPIIANIFQEECNWTNQEKETQIQAYLSEFKSSAPQ